jgi:hypothetical protein
MGDCKVQVLSTTEGLACGWGLVEEGEITEFVYLVNSFIAPSLDKFLVAVDRHTPLSDSRLGDRECFCSAYSVVPIHR